MGISPLGKNADQERLQSTPQSELSGPDKGQQHDQHTAGRNKGESHGISL
tara:strand:+ start:452 stop:601 length:150 start_codon:yes stop_codon:yes gene_type:complete